VLLIIGFFCDCSDAQKQLQQAEANRKEISAVLYRNRYSEDSLKLLLKQYIDEENDFAAMLGYKQLGIFLRENSRFTEAINNHQEGLTLALQLNDTIEIVQAFNNLGTDFRRIGSHGEASDYHYQALDYAEAYSQAHVPGVGMKNRVVSLNGIGNVSLTLGYLDDAEKYFRMALQDEIKLQSPVGQAINYANLGAIFEQRNQLDSAFTYYNKSLEQNQIAKSNMGIGLCLIHLGNLYEKQADYTAAKAEYQQAYNLMEQISDRWHWLVACLSIARIHLLENNIPQFNRYIELAEQTANQINSPEHLAEVYSLKHDFYIRQNNHQAALRQYKLHKEMQDSVHGIQKSNRFLDVRIGYEQNRSTRMIEQVQADSLAKQKERQRALYVTWLFFFIVLVAAAALYYAYRQRTRSNKLLKEMERNRTDFFTNITHEFRTPLTVIQGFSRFMREKKDLSDKEKYTYSEAIERQSINLLNMVNQLLDVTRLKSGKDAPQWRRGDIISYLRMTAETFKLFALEKGVALTFFSELEAQPMDFIPFYMDRVVSNLLSNAIKHTQEGDTIDFTIARGSRPDTIILRVADTGEGIPEEDLQHIFELFYQSQSARNTSGSGIGLSFTKLMVEKMKGSIEVKSQRGKGSNFTVTLPVKNKNLPNIPLLEEEKSVYSLLEKSHTEESALDTIVEVPYEDDADDPGNSLPIILVVEDNKDVSVYIQSVLREKYHVIAAKNGLEGLELAQEHVPDVVVTDLMMPVMDGIELCREIKQSLLLNHIPVIMLTAKSTDEDRIKGLSCGAYAYIRKPFQPEELLICIENVLESRRVLKEKFINEIQSLKKHHRHSGEDTFLLKLNDFLYKELQNTQLNASFVSEAFNMSPSQLNRKLNALTGYSTSSYIVHVKINHAKKLLSATMQTVTEVADACGFYDIAYFSRTFKRLTGMTPVQYQRQYR
jgi:signal transduction histidine kinase/DNA-binding response OmpR family regulator